MPEAISNTSPFLYLFRIGFLNILPMLFGRVWLSTAVLNELEEGKQKGYDVPDPSDFPWVIIEDPKAMPSEWLALDLGPGELATMALALENPGFVVLLDDMLARRTAQAAGLNVWGTLQVLLEAKTQGHIEIIAPLLVQLKNSGMWISKEIHQRILALAQEA